MPTPSVRGTRLLPVDVERDVRVVTLGVHQVAEDVLPLEADVGEVAHDDPLLLVLHRLGRHGGPGEPTDLVTRLAGSGPASPAA